MRKRESTSPPRHKYSLEITAQVYRGSLELVAADCSSLIVRAGEISFPVLGVGGGRGDSR